MKAREIPFENWIKLERIWARTVVSLCQHFPQWKTFSCMNKKEWKCFSMRSVNQLCLQSQQPETNIPCSPLKKTEHEVSNLFNPVFGFIFKTNQTKSCSFFWLLVIALFQDNYQSIHVWMCWSQYISPNADNSQ